MAAPTRTTDSPSPVPEHQRIQDVYRSYEGGRGDGWDTANPGNVAIERERDAAVVESLHTSLQTSIGATGTSTGPPPAPILDLGCGYGAMLDRLEQAGFGPAGLFGAEILFDRCLTVQAGHPATRVVQVDGLGVPFRSGSFAGVVAMTVFSSILDDDVTASVAAEIDRVLRPGGSLHVYDMGVRSPGNPNVRPVTARTLRAHFPDYGTDEHRLTVLPPLSRRLGPAADRWYGPLARITPLLSHRLIRLTKPATTGPVLP